MVSSFPDIGNPNSDLSGFKTFSGEDRSSNLGWRLVDAIHAR
jgi:hypothetical protein